MLVIEYGTNFYTAIHSIGRYTKFTVPFFLFYAGARGASAPGGTAEGRHFEGRKYGIMRLSRFLQIVICIA